MWMKLVFLACLAGVVVAEKSPVFLWGYSSEARPALKTVSQNDFTEIITPLLKDHMIVAFQEENLSTNDFLCSKAKSSQSCYAHLQTVSPKTYYVSVENPTEALRSAAADREFNNVNDAGKLDRPIDCKPGKVVFVNFDDTSAERIETLETHDAAIEAITKDLSLCPTVYLYMATANSNSVQVHSRQRRSTRPNAAAEGGYIFQQPYQFTLFYSSLSLVNVVSENNQQQAQETPIDVTGFQLTNVSSVEFSVVLSTADNKQVTFDIFQSGSNFNMSNLQYDGLTFFTQKIYAPTTFSYYCGNLSLASTANVQGQALLWNSFQMQAPFGSFYNTSVFAEPWDCVGFVTPGICMGFFVVVLFLIIIFTAICWMMDINTMDRFDDPKGKTITINAGE